MIEATTNHQDPIDDSIEDDSDFCIVPQSLQINIRTPDLKLGFKLVKLLRLPVEDELSAEATALIDERRKLTMKKMNLPRLRPNRADSGYPVFGIVTDTSREQRAITNADLSCFLKDLQYEGEGDFVLAAAFARIEHRPNQQKRMTIRYIFNDGRAEDMPATIMKEGLQGLLEQFVFKTAYIFENPDGGDTVNLNVPIIRNQAETHHFVRFADKDEKLAYPQPLTGEETKDKSYRFAPYINPLKK